MKTRFKSNEIAHQWAHQLAEHGTCDQSKSFHGDSFYSYDLEIGRIITRKGVRAFLYLPSGTSSVTTSKHQNDMIAAIPSDAISFEYDTKLSEATGKQILRYSLNRAASEAKAALKATGRKSFRLAEQARYIRQGQTAASYFELKCKPETFDLSHIQSEIARAEKAEAKRKVQAQRNLEKKNAATIAAWMAGDPVHFPGGIERVYLRIGATLAETVVQTSRGVLVPLEAAERAFRFAVARRTKGWHRNGDQFQVGQYQLDAVNTQGIVAGCHRIGWDEIERFAALMGWQAKPDLAAQVA